MQPQRECRQDAERRGSLARVVQTGAECTMTSPPSPSNVRLTISVTPEVHATFQRLAKGSGMSISKAMGEWLGDTLEAAEFMATKIEQARAAPKIVMREMHAYAQGLVDETGALMDRMREEGRQARARQAEADTPALGGLHPPVSNTGGKVPAKGHTGRTGHRKG